MTQRSEPDERPHGYHEPVLVSEVVELMRPVPPGVVVDATFGGGGHTRRLRDELEHVDMIGIDRDPAAVAQNVGSDARVIAANFSDLGEVLSDAGISEVSGVLFDLGVSSHQFDEGDRGFSYRYDGPLDMRMGPDAKTSAADIVNGSDRAELVRILRTYGEVAAAGRVADAIVAARPIRTTGHLAEVVAEATPAALRRQGHPARNPFQAIRIAVNDELSAIEAGVDAAIAALVEHGRCVVISYHSLEDRIVKRRFRDGTRGCTCPPDLPVCACGAQPELRLLTRRSVQPSADEIARNPRSRSARLRAVEKLSGVAS